MLPKQPLGFLGCSGTVRPPDMALEEVFDDAVDAVGFGGAGRDLLTARVASLGNGAQRLGAELAGVLQPEGRVAAEGELARDALVPIADRPAFSAARLYDQIEARKQAVGDLLANRPRFHGLDRADSEPCHFVWCSLG